jgi:predicted DNA-binding transcriptional regulator YafY
MGRAAGGTIAWENRMNQGARTRLVADRFRRVWHIVEQIAAQPGWSRRELADKFHLSERQIQADLDIVRRDMRLPLVRVQGYRFVSEVTPSSPGGFTLQEAILLASILKQTSSGQRRQAAFGSLVSKLPALFPPHLGPIVARTLATLADDRPSPQARVVAAVAEAILADRWIKLEYALADRDVPLRDPIVRPELLIPYLDSWYVIGRDRDADRRRTRMIRLDNVVGIATAQAS